MKNLILFSVLSLLIFSCQDIDTMDKPKNLIPKEEMVEVLTDMAILHGARSYNKKLLEQTGIHPEEYLYKKHGIDSLQFVTSSNYYAEHYVIYNAIYDSVRSNLERLQEKYEKLKIRQEEIQDSIEEAKMQELDSLVDLEKEVPLIEKEATDSLFFPAPVSREDSIF